MLIYSRTTLSFIKKIKARSRVIMAQEMGLIFKTSRFIWRNYHYPLHFVVFDDDKTLGYFDSSCYQIGLNKRLMLEADDQFIDDILRHELAHLYTYLLHQDHYTDLKPHGAEFREVCRQMAWGENIYQAKVNLELSASSLNDESEKHLTKIKKLLSLAQSSNVHEAQAATLKANELLLKHNLQNIRHVDQDDEVSCVKTVLSGKKSDAKMTALYDVLQYFYVRPVLSRKKNKTSLEVVGTRHNVELADYIAKFLHQEFEHYWLQAKADDVNLKGLSKKNSYIAGLAQGFISKLERDKQSSDNNYALVHQQLDRLTHMAFPHLRRVPVSENKQCSQAKSLGHEHGMSLSIRPGLKHSGQVQLLES